MSSTVAKLVPALVPASLWGQAFTGSCRFVRTTSLGLWLEKKHQWKDVIREWLASWIWSRQSSVSTIAEPISSRLYGDMTMKEKDGNTAPYAYWDIYRFRNGKIAELNSFVVKT